MKKYIFYNAFVIVFLVYYLVTSGFIDKVFVKENASFTPALQNAPYPKEFINCIFNMGYYGRPGSECYGQQILSVENHLQRYKNELNFNSLHIYSGASQNDPYHNPPGYSCGGSFEDSINSYRSYFEGLRDEVSSAGIKGIYGRAKIEMPCYFQCVEYEVKPDGGNPSNYNYGFCFNYKMSGVDYTTDSGRTVLYAPAGTSGYLCKDIFENLQHSDLFDWQWSDSIKWKIRPMLRIDSNYVDNFPDSPVVRIDIIRFDSSLLRSVIIKAKNFARLLGNGSYFYAGNYLDSLIFYDATNLLFIGGRDTGGLNYGWNNDWQNWNSSNHVDFRIYTYGNTDVWFDKLTVEDEWAEKLFMGIYDNDKIKAEVNAFTNNDLFSYFADEITYSCFKSVKYVKDKIKEANGNARFYFAMTNYFGVIGLRTDTLYYQAMKDIINPECFATDAHVVIGPVPPIFNDNVNMVIPEYWQSDNYDDYNLFIQNQLLGDKSSISSPENYRWHDFHIPYVLGGLIYQTNLARRFANLCSPKSYLFIQPQIQSNMLKDSSGLYDWNREPTNEEISVQANVSLAHGADGLSWFLYQSIIYKYIKQYDSIINVGMLMLSDSARRTVNYYNQNKWQFVGDMNKVFLNWKPTLDNVNWIAGFSTHTEGTNHYYINDIVSIHRNPAYYFIYDTVCTNCDETKYWEMGFFEKRSGVTGEDYSKYFLMVNRRTVPDMNQDGDYRVLRIKFNNNYLSDFKNWKLIDVNTNQHIEFSSDASTYIYLDSLGYFQPGEGKLFKLAPVLQEGGTLVANENFNTSIMCKKSIFNNEHNITIGPNANISFADSAGIYMTGGNLTIGSETGEPSQSYLQFKGITSSNKWQGFILEDCDSVHIYGTYFYNVLPNQPAISITNCYKFKIKNNSISCGGNENFGGVYAYYTENPQGDDLYQYIGNNTFSFNQSTNYAVEVVSSASPEIPIIIEDNVFNTGSGSESSAGIFLSNITGGVIEQNDISNYINGIILISSSCDFFQNTISGNNEGSIGIQLLIGSGEASPSSNGYFIDGNNNISNPGSNSVNIEVADSYFNMDEGYNTFDIDFINSQRHISGYFPSSANQNYKATYNCFKNNTSQDTASIYVTQGSNGGRITFDTDPYYCGSMDFANYEVFLLAGGINDTIFRKSSGTGGGQKEGQAMAIETQTSYKILKDSININLRKQEYYLTELECKEILLMYPDSSESIGAISKLYLSALSLDNNGNHIQPVKTFFESLILNNPNNTPLIKRANYFVQKCKVALKQYTSALQGFQEIINQNPYSYEGLIASWDYAATTLLANNSGGTSNKEYLYNNSSIETVNSETSNVNEEETENISYFTSHVSHSIEVMLDSLKKRDVKINSYTTDNYDQKKFPKQDRVSINTTVENAFKNERTKQIEKLKELETKITTLSNSTLKNKSDT